MRHQVADAVFQGRQVEGLERGAVFEQEVGVAFFLSRNRGIHDHRQAQRQAFGRGDAARLGDHQVGAGHQALDFASVTLGRQAARILARQCLQGRQLGRVAARQRDQLEVAGNRQQAPRRHAQAAQAGAAAHQQEGRQGRIEAERACAFGTAAAQGKGRHDRDAGDVDPIGGDALRAHAERHFVVGREVAGDVRVHPHAVQVEVRHLDPDRAIEPAPGDFVRQDLGRLEMRADDGVGLERGHLSDQPAAIAPLDPAPQPVHAAARRGAVGESVDMAPQARSALHQPQVGIGVDLAQARRREVHRIEVDRIGVAADRRGGAADRLGGTGMAGAGRHAQHEDALAGHAQRQLVAFHTRRRASAPIRPRPPANRAMLAGSGTAAASTLTLV
jgi:hypothetical protein